MGLSISKQASSTAPKFRKKKMSRIKNGPVLWIDFTDKRTVYSDDMSTKANHNDGIYAVSNKAFDKRFGKADNAALGTALKQATADNRPIYRLSGDLPYALFASTDVKLSATETVGNVGNNLLSQSRLEGDALTLFIVFNLVNSSGQAAIFSMKTGDGVTGQDPLIFQINSDQNVKMFIGDQSDKSGTVIVDSGTATTNNVLQLWTVKLAASGSSVMKKNGSPKITNGASKDHTYAFDINSNHLIQIEGHANGLHVYEILVFNAILPEKEIREVERQLTQKYNL
tara:strand:- start:5809 stop:6660 length:852 start_codon:yes stop_codon:yes gene_type:complete